MNDFYETEVQKQTGGIRLYNKKGSVMKTLQRKQIRSSNSGSGKLKLAAAACWLLAFTLCARADDAPTVPASLVVPAGNEVHFHAHAIGVQIYVWNGSNWVFKAPEAVLYDSAGTVVAIHYAGPTWESTDGSKVVGTKLAGVTVDPTAIPWLLLQAKTTTGPGVLARTAYIQRVNTTAGLAPATPGTTVGQEARVSYTADYYFYRALNDEFDGQEQE